MKRLISVLASTLVAAAFLVSTSAFAAGPWFVSPTGNDSNDCLSVGTACLTIQAAINKASSGDTINVAAGTYNEQVQITKQLTLNGAKTGVDARTRSTVGESIIDNSCGPVQIMADNVVLDGFTIQGATDSTSSCFFAGIWTNPGYSGTQGGHKIYNNIVQNNISGIELDNTGTFPTEVKFNYIKNNNNSGPGSANAIQVNFGLVNVTIDSNKFEGHTNSSFLIPGVTSSNITFSNNELVGGTSERVVFGSVSSSTISGNTSTGGTSSGTIRLFGGNNGIDVTGNTLANGVRGVRITNDFAPNSDITVNQNNLTGNSAAGLEVGTTAYSGGAGSLNATCNWWDSASGPTNASNPGGTGDAVVDPDGVVDFTPWLTASAPGGPCNGPIQTGSIVITKYACPPDAIVTRAANGVGGTVPAGCVLDSGKTFGYVHGTQTDANAPFPELAGPFTPGGTTNGSGVLTIPSLPADGRYLIVETDGSNAQLPASAILGLYCQGDGDTSGTNDNQELTFVAADQTVQCVAYNKAPPTFKVVVTKFIDGVQATAANANSSSFPMLSTTLASNVNGGVQSGPNAYTLDVNNAYHATTTDMASGANYSTNEVTGGSVVGASCTDGKPYALAGYSSGDTLALAQAAATSTTAPSFTGLTSDKYVVVRNITCAPAPTFLKVHILKYLDNQQATAISANNYDFPMTATWSAPSGSGSGNYVLGNNHGGAPDLYGANTSNMQSPADYSTAEVTSGSSNVLPTNAACVPGKYRLLGYKSSNVSFADAATQATSSSAAFTGLTADKWVLVYDETCPTPPPPPPANACSLTQAPAGYTLRNGTVGSDTVTLAPFTMFVGKGGNDSVTAPDGNYIICTGKGNDTIKLGNGDYTINAGGGNNTITTGNGAGPITTGAGNDTITTGNGAHTINAGAGNNTITTGDGVQNVTTLGGNDKITTGSGSDTISAGGGNNTVKSGAGDDSVSTLGGNDVINGGAGAADFCSAGGGTNTVTSCELP